MSYTPKQLVTITSRLPSIFYIKNSISKYSSIYMVTKVTKVTTYNYQVSILGYIFPVYMCKSTGNRGNLVTSGIFIAFLVKNKLVTVTRFIGNSSIVRCI